MSSTSVAVDSESEFHIPGEPGIWILICGDLLIFSLFFGVFLHSRSQNVEIFRAAQSHLNQAFGALNTLLMLSSSWLVALGVRAARQSLGIWSPLLFTLALICGAGFVVVKVFEYGEKIRAGITLLTNDFFMYYFVFTGIHLLHVLIGMGVLSALALYSRSGGFNAGKIRNLESGASFWHLVDVLWIVLFPLLYLVR